MQTRWGRATKTACVSLTLALMGCGGRGEDSSSPRPNETASEGEQDAAGPATDASDGEGDEPTQPNETEPNDTDLNDDESEGGDESIDTGSSNDSDETDTDPSSDETTEDGTPDAGGMAAAPAPLPDVPTGACLSSGWCWSARDYFGDQISTGARGIEDGSVFAASREGHVLQWVNDRFVYHEGIRHDLEEQATLNDTELESIVVINDHDVWVGGFSGAWHYDGETWQQVATQRVAALEYAQGKIWATLDGQLFVREGNDWVDAGLAVDAGRHIPDLLRSEDGETLWAVDFPDTSGSGASPATVYVNRGDGWDVVGSSPAAFFTPELLFINGQLYVSGGEVWNVDEDWASWGIGEVYTLFNTPNGNIYYTTVDGLFRWDGAQGQFLHWAGAMATWPADDQNIWLSPYTGGALLFDPTTDSVTDRPASSNFYDFDAVPTAVWADGYVAWGASDSDVWRGRTTQETVEYQRRLEHFDGTSWNVIWDNLEINDIHGCSSDDVWIAPSATNTLSHWDGETLHDDVLPTELIRMAYAVRCISANDVWMIGSTFDQTVEVVHYDGQNWTTAYSQPYSVGRATFLPYLDSAAPGKFWFSANADIYSLNGSEGKLEFSFDTDMATPIVSRAGTLWLFAVDGLHRWQDGKLQSVERPPLGPRGTQFVGPDLWIWSTEHALVKRFPE